jgi:nitrogen fixation protein NifU and related proteins
MSDEIDVFVQRFQEMMVDEARVKFGEVAFERWQNPLHMGVILDADAFGHARRSCGDSVVIYLKFENERVCNAAFQTDGCAPTIICGSFAAESAFDKTPEEIMRISETEIMARAGGLPEENEHCAALALGALHEAVNNYRVNQTREEK